MKLICEIVGAVILSVGGAGVIILGLSSWLGKVWANRILESEKKQHQIEIEEYKSQLVKSINELNARNDKALHISKVQYDTEFEIYKEIWEKLFNCIKYTDKLYQMIENVPADKEKLDEYNYKKYNNYEDAYNSFAITIDKYAPFYKEEFYDKFLEIKRLCYNKGFIFKQHVYDIPYNESFKSVRDAKMTKEERNLVYKEIPKKLEELQESLRKDIRGYLLSLEIK